MFNKFVILQRVNILSAENVLIVFRCSIADQPSNQIVAVFREWISCMTTTTTNTDDNSKLVTDRSSLERIKRIKNLLTDSIPDEQVVKLA